MPYYISIILYFSIIIPVIVGCIRLNKIDATYFPFLLCIFLGFAHETISFFLIINGYNNVPVSNIYLLIEIPVLLWLFYNWRPPSRSVIIFYILMSVLLIAWIAECIAYGGISLQFNSYYIVISSFVLVLLSINQINSLMVTESSRLIKHPVFLVCIGFIIFFSYSILVEVFSMYGLFEDKSFEANIQHILEFINLTVNLIFTLALIWIPVRQKFILQSSSLA